MNYIIGVDEAGRGPLAGPVFASAVLYNANNEPIFAGINDSKKLTEKKRNTLFDEIRNKAIYSSIESSSVLEIDKINILQASLLAMKRAIEKVIEYVTQCLNTSINYI